MRFLIKITDNAIITPGIATKITKIKRYTKGTVRYTLVHLQLGDLGIQKVEMALAQVGDV